MAQNRPMWHVREHRPFKEAMELLRETGDSRLAEVEALRRRLVERGPDLPEARPVPIPMGVALVLDGWHYVLEDGTAFIEYVRVPDRLRGGDPGIVLVRMLDLDY